ncbi:AMP-binding protein [Aquabacterium sp. J223]|uniref:AMP-binding protein n=1 Tax=Aquabacterium sp. J223 TaxID=2898431 RepID=UPI0021AD5209|nr:AMP-binding protein [Aquabacterium sp. J223]UUX94223.1 AMP-binding protein [Aquabacterium sp. J223]
MTAHVDTFAKDRLPPPEQQPDFLFDRPELQFPPQLNCAAELLDRWVDCGQGDRLCLQGPGVRWTYEQLQAEVNRIANVLVHDCGLVPGQRVLLRGPNAPRLVACWFAVVKAGGIAVGSMPLLRAKELCQIVQKAEIGLALCDARLADELALARPQCPSLQRVLHYHGDAPDGAPTLEALAAAQPATFDAVPTAADDTCLIAFTSGTTGAPKGTMHFHRDVMAACACWPVHTLKATPDDVFIGSPPLAFTFGLGGLVLFPMSIGASTVLIEKATPEALPAAIERFKATVCFTAPTAYRAMAAKVAPHDLRSLRKCVSAGEALPAATRALWKQATGIELIDGIGATELLHIFISHTDDEARPGATGKLVPGYVACVVDEQLQPLPPNTVGRLAVKGPTGCRYLADERQRRYVQDGWNITGDAYWVDDDGWFHYQSRVDDMIISGGYNIGGPEVEDCLLQHPAVAECAVIGWPDEERGQVVKAFVVPRPSHTPGEALVRALQDHVKASIAPYKYPRAIEFRDSLPRTETGKLQRFKLREAAATSAAAASSTAQAPA